jgi:serine protease Do
MLNNYKIDEKTSMKKIIISLLLGMLFASSHAQSIPETIKGINNILTPSAPVVVPEKLPDLGTPVENKTNISSHMVLSKINAIVKVQVQSRLGKEKIAVGSGSIIREDGLIVTNYHVISSHFSDPANNKIVYSVGKNSEEIVANLEAVDLVNDLALIKPLNKVEYKDIVELEKGNLQQGEKIYSLGFPHNWSMTMIEGIFNGYMDKQLTSHYLVSHALSSGMSGGPTFNEEGKLVAINVAATNKLSILIPATSLSVLLSRYKQEVKAYPSKEQYIPKIDLIRDNAISRYADFSEELLTQIIKSDSLEIGKFKLPLRNKLFECWSRREKPESSNLDKVEIKQKEDLLQIERTCSTQDNIFLQESNTIGQISVNTYYYQNNNSTPFVMWKTLEKKFNVVAIKNENTTDAFKGTCFINNITNSGKKLQKMQICISPLKETNRLWRVQIAQIYQDGFNQAMILDFLFDGFTEKSIKKIIGYTKKI